MVPAPGYGEVPHHNNGDPEKVLSSTVIDPSVNARSAISMIQGYDHTESLRRPNFIEKRRMERFQRPLPPAPRTGFGI